LGCTWVLLSMCDSCQGAEAGAAEAWALLRPGSAHGPAQPRCPRSCGVAVGSVVVGGPRNVVYQLLKATLACFLVGFLPPHDRFLQIHFSRSQVVPGKPCQSSLISMCGLGGLGEAVGTVIVDFCKAPTWDSLKCTPGLSVPFWNQVPHGQQDRLRTGWLCVCGCQGSSLCQSSQPLMLRLS
jgi:hypothetical protein